MNPFLAQITAPLVLQGFGVLVSLGAVGFTIYSGIRNWTRADRDKRAAVEEKRELAFTQMLEAIRNTQIDVKTLQEENKRLAERDKEEAREAAKHKERLSGFEHQMELMQQFFTDSMNRQEATLNHFLEYAKQSTSLTESVSKIATEASTGEKWMNKYLQGIEDKIKVLDVKLDTLVKRNVL